jgi:MscS family membrane protein
MVLIVSLLVPVRGSSQNRSSTLPKGHTTSAAKSKASPSPPKEEDNPPTAPASSPVPPPDPLGRSTPYGCVIGFLKAVNDNNLGVAIQYLDTKLQDERAEELAKELKAVLDANPSSNINRLSKEEQGDIVDGLRLSREKMATAKTSNGDLDIFLDRVQRQQGPPVWLFASETLDKIPSTYAQLHTHDFSARFPEPLRKIQFLGLPLWRWLAICLTLVVIVLQASVVARILLWIFKILLHRGNIRNEEEILRKLKRPLRILLLFVAISVASQFSLSLLARHYWGVLARVLGVVGLAWLVASLVDLAAQAGTRRSLVTGVQQKIAIITLFQRLTKILLVLTVLIIFLRDAGINVSAMLAGLGIGGIALALAAQNTLQDLFGGISIIMRDTLRVGDFCRVGDQTGTIEDIGLSSTRLRTLDRTVVSIPNSKIAQVSSENFSLRDKFWFHHLLSLRPDTTWAQVNRVLSDVEKLMCEDASLEPGSNRINLVEFREAAFQIEFFAYVVTDTYPNFLKLQQALLQKIFDAISQVGARLAMTSQTAYIETLNMVPQPAEERTPDKPR